MGKTLDFTDSTLWISGRSPFARRVRVTLRENGVRHEEKLVDVWVPQPSLNAINPLGRVPTLVLKSGEVLIDSSEILRMFYETHLDSPLRPKDLAAQTEASHWSAIATGVCDKAIEWFLEIQRPDAHRDQDLLEECRGAIERSLVAADRVLSERGTVTGQAISQADLDLGVALAYLKLRYKEAPGSEWQSRHTTCARFLERMSERPSFQATVPPAVTA